MDPSTALRRRQSAVAEFLMKFHELLRLCEREPSWGGSMPRWVLASTSNEARVSSLVSDLNLLTGAAAKAVAGVGIEARYKPRGTHPANTVPVNPVLVWTTLFADPMTTAEIVIQSCQQAIGILESDAVDAEEREASFEGKVERIAAKPRNLWRAVIGAPREARAHKSAAWGGAFVALLIAVVAGAILHVLGWT